MSYTNFDKVGAENGFGIGKKGAEKTVLSDVINASVTLDPASIAAGATGTNTLTVTGAALGDHVLVSPPYDLGGLEMGHPVVSAADTVKITLRNNTAAAIDLASGTWKAKVLKG
jgi:hypothetical protein